MTKNYLLSDFKFSSKRVRYRGRALSRFDIALILEEICPSLPWTKVCDAYYYDDFVYIFKTRLFSCCS